MNGQFLLCFFYGFSYNLKPGMSVNFCSLVNSTRWESQWVNTANIILMGKIQTCNILDAKIWIFIKCHVLVPCILIVPCPYLVCLLNQTENSYCRQLKKQSVGIWIEDESTINWHRENHKWWSVAKKKNRSMGISN